MSIERIGKSIKSPVDETIYLRFIPDGTVNPAIKTLPAGKPSDPITSFILRDGIKYYQINDNDYIKASDRMEFVDPSADDESGYLSGAYFAISDWLKNTGSDAEKKAGFLSDGFKKSISEVKTGFFNLNSAIKPILILVLAIYGLSVLRPLIQKITNK